ncbi:MAG: hypothetical protein H7125_07155 [Proteobacteria bacterium]|nr:hypothetical protein [Burkholderiales bacterium]
MSSTPAANPLRFGIAVLSLCLAAVAQALAQPSTPPEKARRLEALLPDGSTVLVRRYADFNADGVRDAVVVAHRRDRADDPRTLVIAFGHPAGGYTLSLRSDTAIPEVATGGAAARDGFDELQVLRNTFTISRYGGSSVQHSERWQFRFQDGDWFLIGERLSTGGNRVRCPTLSPRTEARADETCVGYTVDSNFVTGRQQITHLFDGEATRNAVVRRALPKKALVRLAEFSPQPWAPFP